MGVQRADDPARNLTNVWLGTDIIRNATRARYITWAVFAFLWPLLGVVFWLVIPTGLLLLAGLLYVGRIVMARNPPVAVFYVCAGLGVAGILVPDLAFWMYPLPWWGAWLPAMVTAVLLCRRLMPHVDPNRPVRYWLRSLDAAASAPRPTRAPLVASAVVEDRSAGLDLTDLDMQSLLTKEHDVARYEPITTPVEAERWLPGNLEAAAAFRAWLSEHGLKHEVIEREAGRHVVDLTEWHIVVQPGEWLILALDAVTRPSEVMRDAEFRRSYREVVDAP